MKKGVKDVVREKKLVNRLKEFKEKRDLTRKVISFIKEITDLTSEQLSLVLAIIDKVFRSPANPIKPSKSPLRGLLRSLSPLRKLLRDKSYLKILLRELRELMKSSQLTRSF